MSGSREGARQKGAALIIVLLLVATLAFISLAMSERMMLSARRAVNMRQQNVLIWRALAIETLAKSAIETQMAASKGKLSLSSPLVAKPIVIPGEGGTATVAIVDRTRCFNLNSMVVDDGNGQTANAEAKKEFETLAASTGAANFDAPAIAAAIIDWIDRNTFQEPGGAEDAVYADMPTPYRTGAQPLADVSELRAVAGVTREDYAAIAPFLCAQPSSAPSPVNINMLQETDAPLLVAISGGRLSVTAAQDVIAATPPGGFDTIDEFFSNDKIRNLGIKEFTNTQFNLWSRYLEADAVIGFADGSADLSVTFEVDQEGKAHVLSRRLGRFE